MESTVCICSFVAVKLPSESGLDMVLSGKKGEGYKNNDGSGWELAVKRDKVDLSHFHGVGETLCSCTD